MFSVQSKAALKSESAFTRMDLAVVIATSAVLFTLLISAHAKPRNRVYQTTDVNNQRRLLQAATAYAADHNDTMPYSGWSGSLANWAWAVPFPFPPGAGGTFVIYTYYPQQLAMVTNGQTFPYIQDSRVFVCPADRPSNRLFWQRYQYVTSYMWNGAVSGGGASTVSYKLSQFRPDAILQWEADEQAPFLFNDTTAFPDEGISLRHGTNFMFGMFGGGVGTVTTSAWYGSSLAGNTRGYGGPVYVAPTPLPNRLWCSPSSANGLF